MVPINALMTFLIVSRSPAWVAVTASVVLLLSAHAFVRGYVTRLSIDNDGIRLRRLTGSIFISWIDIREIGEYAPGGGVGGTEYVYVTTRSCPPKGKWDVDEKTIQVQSRAGILEALNDARAAATADIPSDDE